MDVMNPEQARIAEKAGAVAGVKNLCLKVHTVSKCIVPFTVMALERIPADIRKDGGVARMSDPKMIKEIKAAVSIPVMAKCRIGHFVEAQILEAIGIDYIDESEVSSDLITALKTYHELIIVVLCVVGSHSCRRCSPCE